MFSKNIIFLFIPALTKWVYSFELNNDAPVRRLLLHSVEDVAAEVLYLRETVSSFEARLEALEQKSAGSVFTRWGRKTCPDNTEFLYKGFLAGKKYTENGGGVDSLCLPEEPKWGKYHDGNEATTTEFRAYIYGGEVDTNDGPDVFPYSVKQQDMPCAVCQTNNSKTVMIPARNMCYPGWKKEYSGYLMAASVNTKAHNHICLDGEPEFLEGGGSNDNEHILYIVEGRCGSLPCPPYVHGRELTCVVCSK